MLRFSGEKSAAAFCLAILAAVLFDGCAASNPSVGANGPGPVLFKVGTPEADSLFSKMPGAARSAFKSMMDSVPGDYRYSVSDGTVSCMRFEKGELVSKKSFDGDSLVRDYQKGAFYRIFDADTALEIEGAVHLADLEGDSISCTECTSKFHSKNGTDMATLTAELYKGDAKKFKFAVNLNVDLKVSFPDSLKRYNDRGILVKEMIFPKFIKEYGDNGNLKVEASGLLYRKPDGNVGVEEGIAKEYYDNGQIKLQKEYKNRLAVVIKEWSETGICKRDIDNNAGRYKWFYEDGSVYIEFSGLVYLKGEIINFDSGEAKLYYRNGQLYLQKRYKNRKMEGGTQWFENGVLQSESDVTKGEHVMYYPDGKKSEWVSGKFQYETEDGGSVILISGISKKWDDQGNLVAEMHRDSLGHLTSERLWNDKGVLVSDIAYPKYIRSYYDNGVIKEEIKGNFFYDARNELDMKDGSITLFDEKGVWKGLITKKNGVNRAAKFRAFVDAKDGGQKELVIEGTYDSLGMKISSTVTVGNVLRSEESGSYYQNGDSLDVGYRKKYFDSGKLQTHLVYKNTKIVGKKEWNEQGALLMDVEVPRYYREYYPDGKLSQEAVGEILEENRAFKVKNGEIKAYGPDGKIYYSAVYKNFEPVSENRGDP